MTIKQGLDNGLQKLSQKQIERPDLEAELLLSAVLKKDRVWLLAHPEQKLNFWQKLRYNQLVYLKSNGWPTAYLTGHQGFFGLDFLVNRDTLIPRPETELLVETALKLIPPDEAVEVIETGVGSGCIIISVAQNNPNTKTNYQAIDISKGVLKIAHLNAGRYGMNNRIRFIQGSVLAPFVNDEFPTPLIILANLPYLRPDQFASSPSIQKEPQSALVSGVDGLDLYRELLQQTTTIKAKNITLILEIDPSQSTIITQLAKDHWPDSRVEIIKDFCGHDRIVVIKIK